MTSWAEGLSYCSHGLVGMASTNLALKEKKFWARPKHFQRKFSSRMPGKDGDFWRWVKCSASELAKQFGAVGFEPGFSGVVMATSFWKFVWKILSL